MTDKRLMTMPCNGGILVIMIVLVVIIKAVPRGHIGGGSAVAIHLMVVIVQILFLNVSLQADTHI